jgi:hypothetical protein
MYIIIPHQSCNIIHSTQLSSKLNQIWNCDETRIQARWWSRVKVLVKKGSQQVYSTIPKSKEWRIVNCVINATSVFLPKFFIFKGERIKGDYIRNCRPRTCMVMQNIFPFQGILVIFCKFSLLKGIFQFNIHILILDGHGSHVTLKAIEQAQIVGLNMVILP